MSADQKKAFEMLQAAQAVSNRAFGKKEEIWESGADWESAEYQAACADDKAAYAATAAAHENFYVTQGGRFLT